MPTIHRAPVSPKVLASLDLGFFKPLIAWTFEPISKPIEPVLGGWEEIDGLPEVCVIHPLLNSKLTERLSTST